MKTITVIFHGAPMLVLESVAKLGCLKDGDIIWDRTFAECIMALNVEHLNASAVDLGDQLSFAA